MITRCCSRQCSSAERVMEVLGVSLDATVDLSRVDYNFKMFKDGRSMARSQLAAQARRRHTFLLPILSDVLPLESLLVLFDQRQLPALYKQLQVWKCLKISSSFPHLSRMFSHAFGITPSHRLLYLLSARRRVTCTLRALHHAYT